MRLDAVTMAKWLSLPDEELADVISQCREQIRLERVQLDEFADEVDSMPERPEWPEVQALRDHAKIDLVRIEAAILGHERDLEILESEWRVRHG